jgi:hypothetical protein
MLTRQEAIARMRDWCTSYEVVGAGVATLRAALSLAWTGRVSELCAEVGDGVKG